LLYQHGFEGMKEAETLLINEAKRIERQIYLGAALFERSERALKLAIAQMYVQGVSTRKMASITEELIGTEVSSMQVSRAAAELDQVLSTWRERQLSQDALTNSGRVL